MQDKIYLTPQSWCDLTGIIILDPDGWDRTAANFEKDWNTPLNWEQFISKMTNSTVCATGLRSRNDLLRGAMLNLISLIKS